MYRKVFSHSLIYGLGPFIPKLINLLMLPIFTSMLSSADYGIQSIVNSSLGLISVFAMLGLQLPIMNAFYHHPNHYKKRWGQFYGFLNLWMIIYACILTAILYVIIPVEAYSNRWWIIILTVAPIVCFGSTATIGQTYFQLSQQPQQVVVRTVIISFLTISINYYTIVILDLHYMGWFISSGVDTLLLNISYWYPLRYKLKLKPIYRFKKYVIKKGLSISLPMIPHYYSAYLLGSVDTLLLNFFSISIASIGIYGFAASFGGIMAMLVGALNTAVSPIMYDLIKNKKTIELRNLTWMLQLLLIGFSIILCIWMKEIFEIFIKNNELKRYYYLATIFIMAHMYRPMYFGVTSILFYKEKTKNLWKITFCSGVVCVLLNIILIPLFGFKIPAYVLFFSFLLMGYCTFFLRDYKDVKTVNFRPIYFLILTVLSLLTVYVLIEMDVFTKLIFSLFLTVFSFFFYFYYEKLLFFIRKMDNFFINTRD